MPRNDRLIQSLFAAAMIPAVAVGLTACSPSDDASSPRADDDSSNSDTERVDPPFVWGEDAPGGSDEPTEPTIAPPPEPSATAPTNPGGGSGSDDDDDDDGDTGNSGGSGSSGGENVVKWGEYDMSDKDWDVACTDDYANGYVFEGDDMETYHSVSVSMNEDGSVDYVMIDSDEAESLYFSDGISEPEFEASGTYEVNQVMEVTGIGALNDEYEEFVEFDIKLTCDSTF